MKKWKIALLSAGIVLVSGVVLSWDKISEIRALMEYSQIFKPENIDVNFRSMHAQYASIPIKRDGPVYELPFSLRADAMPQTYDFEGLEKNPEAFLKHSDTTGLIIMHAGQVVYENYDRGNTKSDHSIAMSVSKSMTSMLIGVALSDGLLELDDPVTKYAPWLKGSGYDGATIKNVLEMSSGIRWSEDEGDLNSELVRSLVASLLGSLDEFATTLELEKTPGSYNHYVSMDTQILGMVLRGATGKPYEEYFQEKLWSKLGAESDVQMLVDSVGQPMAFSGVNARLRDLLRFGKLYLDEGRNHLGAQLVSAEWVNVSTRPDSPRLMPMINNPESDSGFGYKYQWWVPLTPDHNDFSAIGIYGQFVYVNPKRDVVIAKSSAYKDYLVDGGMMNHETLVLFQAIAKHLSPDEFEPSE